MTEVFLTRGDMSSWEVTTHLHYLVNKNKLKGSDYLGVNFQDMNCYDYEIGNSIYDLLGCFKVKEIAIRMLNGNHGYETVRRTSLEKDERQPPYEDRLHPQILPPQARRSIRSVVQD